MRRLRTEHEVAALQPAARGREPKQVADGKNSDSGVATINSHIVGVRAREQQDQLPQEHGGARRGARVRKPRRNRSNETPRSAMCNPPLSREITADGAEPIHPARMAFFLIAESDAIAIALRPGLNRPMDCPMSLAGASKDEKFCVRNGCVQVRTTLALDGELIAETQASLHAAALSGLARSIRSRSRGSFIASQRSLRR